MSRLITQAIVEDSQDTASNWTANDTILNMGETGIETDTGYTKKGDGATAWTSLEYSTNMVFASFYGNNIAWTQVAVQNTWYNISDADIADGQLNKITHDGSGKLTLSEAGKYKIDYSLSLESSLQNKHIETGIELNSSGSAEGPGQQHIHLPNVAAIANTEWAVSGTCIYDLSIGDTIEITVGTTDAGTPTITVDHINLAIIQIYKSIV